MDELSDCSVPVLEFKTTITTDRQNKLKDIASSTDPLPACKDIACETTRKCQGETQTEQPAMKQVQVDDQKLLRFLRRVCPKMEEELLKGPTPLQDSINSDPIEDIKIQPYQKIIMGNAECCQGLATWLSVHTSNAPVLIVSNAPTPHDDWCEHVQQCMKLYVPKRAKSGNFVAFTEVKSVPLKACLKNLCTNSYNKNMFAGSTQDGDIYIWQYVQNSANDSQAEVEELHNVTPVRGYALALGWSAENRLLSCHANGWVMQWLIGKEISLEWEYKIKSNPNAPAVELTTIVCLSLGEFVVGTKDGMVFQCWHSSANVGASKKQLEVTPLRQHRFAVTSLMKVQETSQSVVISCDLSGQVFYHNIRNHDDKDTKGKIIVQIPLPFKNAIACSRDGGVIYCPSLYGSLECYRIQDGGHSVIKGELRGKGNFIKCSDNGCWIITGLYENEFQIFNVED